MNEESRKFFLEGPLRYEQMFYDFTRKIFNERLKYLYIHLSKTIMFLPDTIRLLMNGQKELH